LPLPLTAPRGIRRDGPLLFVSHLYPYKMVEEMIVGYSIARRAQKFNSRLLIAGASVDEAYRRRLENTISRLGETDHVRLLGNVKSDELTELYRSARAFIFPSIS